MLSIDIFSKCPPRAFGMAPCTLITTGTTMARLFHNLSISDFGTLWTSPILCSVFYYLLLLSHQLFTFFFSTTVTFGILWAKSLSVYMQKSHNIVTCSFSTTFSTLCFHQFFKLLAHENYYGSFSELVWWLLPHCL